MAKRSSSRSGGGRRSRGLEVEEKAPAKEGAGLEETLIWITFVALILGLVLSTMELSSSFGKGPFG